MVNASPQAAKCLKGAEEIGEYIKESGKEIPRLVIEEGLPAFRRNNKGPWRSYIPALDAWMEQQIKKHVARTHNMAKQTENRW